MRWVPNSAKSITNEAKQEKITKWVASDEALLTLTGYSIVYSKKKETITMVWPVHRCYTLQSTLKKEEHLLGEYTLPSHLSQSTTTQSKGYSWLQVWPGGVGPPHSPDTGRNTTSWGLSTRDLGGFLYCLMLYQWNLNGMDHTDLPVFQDPNVRCLFLLLASSSTPPIGYKWKCIQISVNNWDNQISTRWY